MSAAQIPLDLALPRRRSAGRAGFIVSASNAAALTLLDSWRDWPERRMALVGPEGVGKSHLAHIWMGEAGAEKVTARHLRAEDAPALLSGGAAVVEDADRIGGAEAALFHLLNLAKEEGARLLITGRGAPNGWPIRTPDLASRLSAMPVAEIAPPDDALLAGLLAKQFAERRLKLGAGVIDYLLRRMDRSAHGAALLADRLDAAALQEGRALTLPFVRSALAM